MRPEVEKLKPKGEQTCPWRSKSLTSEKFFCDGGWQTHNEAVFGTCSSQKYGFICDWAREKLAKNSTKTDEPVPMPGSMSKNVTSEEFSPYKTQIGGNHYKDNFPVMQPWEFFSRNNIPFADAHPCKHILRHRFKNGVEDLKKAKHELELLAWDCYGVKI